MELPDSGCIAGGGALGLMAGQELVEVSILHVLSDHAEGVFSNAHCQQPDDVGVLESRHDLNLLQKVIPFRSRSHMDRHTQTEPNMPGTGISDMKYKPGNVTTKCNSHSSNEDRSSRGNAAALASHRRYPTITGHSRAKIQDAGSGIP